MYPRSHRFSLLFPLLVLLFIIIIIPLAIYAQSGPPSCPNNPIGDVDCSGETTTQDLLLLVGLYGSNNIDTDLDKSSKINSIDFSILVNILNGNQQLLKSNFFKYDQLAQKIAVGEITDLLITESYFEGDLDEDKFQYKLFNAFRMLGYAHIGMTISQPMVEWARSFMQDHNIPSSDYITADFLLALDKEVADHEQAIQSIAAQYPINESFDYNGSYVEYISHHGNEPPKDHIRYFMSYLLLQLPPYTAPFSVKNSYEFLSHQGHGMIFYDDRWKLNYMPSAPPLDLWSKGIYKQHSSDVDNVTTFLHEYGHQIDSNLYGYLSPTSGMVNTDDFYPIIFDMSSCINPAWTYCKWKPEAKFVSQYAQGWEPPDSQSDYHSINESFAESFAFYILHGNLYRELAFLDENYQLQYEWLKKNVFNDLEYCTGDEQLMSWDSPMWDYSIQDLPDGVATVSRSYIYLRTSPEQPVFTIQDFIQKCGTGD